jgi:hypothetical protein
MAKKKGGLVDNRVPRSDDYDDEQEDYVPGSELISKFKPDQFVLDERPTVDKTFYWYSPIQADKEFKKAGLSLSAINSERQISALQPYHKNTQAEKFFQKVDITTVPITCRVQSMHRQKVTDWYLDKKTHREKQKEIEALTYHLQLEGESWLGETMHAGIENEGMALAPKMTIKVEVDEYGRQHGEYVMQGTRNKYYMEYKGKKQVDDILKKYDTDKDTVLWYGKFPNQGRDNGYSYDQFVNLDWDQFSKLAKREGGAAGKKPIYAKDKKLIVGWE